MGKDLCKAIPSSTSSHVTHKLEKDVASIERSHDTTIVVCGDFTRYTSVLFLKHNSDDASKCEDLI